MEQALEGEQASAGTKSRQTSNWRLQRELVESWVPGLREKNGQERRRGNWEVLILETLDRETHPSGSHNQNRGQDGSTS